MSQETLDALYDKRRMITAEIEDLLGHITENLQSNEYTKLMNEYQRLLIKKNSVLELIDRLEKLK